MSEAELIEMRKRLDKLGKLLEESDLHLQRKHALLEHKNPAAAEKIADLRSDLEAAIEEVQRDQEVLLDWRAQRAAAASCETSDSLAEAIW